MVILPFCASAPQLPSPPASVLTALPLCHFPNLLTELDLPAPEPCPAEAFMDIVIDNWRRPTVILMDELEAGLTASELDDGFWWSLRALANHYTNGQLAFVSTSGRIPLYLARSMAWYNAVRLSDPACASGTAAAIEEFIHISLGVPASALARGYGWSHLGPPYQARGKRLLVRSLRPLRVFVRWL